MFGLLCVVVCTVAFLSGPCEMEGEGGALRAICSGRRLHRLPTVPRDVAERVWVLGVARNHISRVTAADLAKFPHLQILDVRDQYAVPCVAMEVEPSDLTIIGEIYIYLSSFKLFLSIFTS